MKFNSKQLLFEAFLHVMRIFGSAEPYIECILPFLYNIIFQLYQFFEPLSSTPREEDRHMRLRTFLYAIQFKQLLFEAFLISCVFLTTLSHKVKLIFHFCTIRFQTY